MTTKIYRCKFCLYETDKTLNHLRHKDVHIVLTERQNIDVSNAQKCPFCTGLFKTSYALKQHMVYYCTEKPIAENVSICAENVSIPCCDANGLYNCPLCYKSYTRKSTLCRHIPECEKKVDPCECPICHKILNYRSSLSRHLKTCNPILETVPEEPPPPPPIQLHRFGKETTAHITRDELMGWIRQISGDGIPELVKKIHFDKDVPENNNIHIQSRKKHTVKVFKDGEWVIEDTNEAIGRMMDKAFQMMYHLYMEPNSKIRYDDEHFYEFYIMKTLLEIASKNPKKYKQITRRIYIHLLNQSEGIKNDAASSHPS